MTLLLEAMLLPLFHTALDCRGENICSIFNPLSPRQAP